MDAGAYLKKLRKDKNLTLRELAKISGVSHPYISQLENGRNSNPDPRILSKLSKALNSDFDEICSVFKVSSLEDFNPVGGNLQRQNDREVFTDLRTLRKSKGLTVDCLAKRTSLSNSYISQIENGKKIPSLRACAEIADGLEVSRIKIFRMFGYSDLIESLVEGNDLLALQEELDRLRVENLCLKEQLNSIKKIIQKGEM